MSSSSSLASAARWSSISKLARSAWARGEPVRIAEGASSSLAATEPSFSGRVVRFRRGEQPFAPSEVRPEEGRNVIRADGSLAAPAARRPRRRARGRPRLRSRTGIRSGWPGSRSFGRDDRAHRGRQQVERHRGSRRPSKRDRGLARGVRPACLIRIGSCARGPCPPDARARSVCPRGSGDAARARDGGYSAPGRSLEPSSNSNAEPLEIVPGAGVLPLAHQVAGATLS